MSWALNFSPIAVVASTGRTLQAFRYAHPDRPATLQFPEVFVFNEDVVTEDSGSAAHYQALVLDTLSNARRGLASSSRPLSGRCDDRGSSEGGCDSLPRRSLRPHKGPAPQSQGDFSEHDTRAALLESRRPVSPHSNRPSTEHSPIEVFSLERSLHSAPEAGPRDPTPAQNSLITSHLPGSAAHGAVLSCPLSACGITVNNLTDLCGHINRSHLAFIRGASPEDVLRTLRAAGLEQCSDCRVALCTASHDCPMAGRVACPVPGCRMSAGKRANILTHLRNDHQGVQLPPEEERCWKIGRCKHCLCYFKGVQAHQQKCKKRLGGVCRVPPGGASSDALPGLGAPPLPGTVSLERAS